MQCRSKQLQPGAIWRQATFLPLAGGALQLLLLHCTVCLFVWIICLLSNRIISFRYFTQNNSFSSLVFVFRGFIQNQGTHGPSRCPWDVVASVSARDVWLCASFSQPHLLFTCLALLTSPSALALAQVLLYPLEFLKPYVCC